MDLCRIMHNSKSIPHSKTVTLNWENLRNMARRKQSKSILMGLTTSSWKEARRRWRWTIYGIRTDWRWKYKTLMSRRSTGLRSGKCKPPAKCKQTCTSVVIGCDSRSVHHLKWQTDGQAFKGRENADCKAEVYLVLGRYAEDWFWCGQM